MRTLFALLLFASQAQATIVHSATFDLSSTAVHPVSGLLIPYGNWSGRIRIDQDEPRIEYLGVSIEVPQFSRTIRQEYWAGGLSGSYVPYYTEITFDALSIELPDVILGVESEPFRYPPAVFRVMDHDGMTQPLPPDTLRVAGSWTLEAADGTLSGSFDELFTRTADWFDATISVDPYWANQFGVVTTPDLLRYSGEITIGGNLAGRDLGFTITGVTPRFSVIVPEPPAAMILGAGLVLVVAAMTGHRLARRRLLEGNARPARAS